MHMLNEQEIDNENHRVMRTELYINVDIGATVSTSPYEDVDTEFTPLLLLYLQAGDFFFQGAQFGHSVFEAQSALEMGVGLDSVN